MFPDNIKEYLKYFGVFYVLIIVILIGAGISYLNVLPELASEKLVPMQVPEKDTTKPEADLPMIKGILSPPVDVKLYLAPSKEIVEKGKTLFTTNCVSCHGNEGKGDGVAGVNLNPKPRNFHELTGWTNGPELPKMFKTLQDGITNRGMASYANFPPEDRLALISYVRAFNPNFPPITEAQLKEIDTTYSLAKGVKQPNQIPMKMAIEKIMKERGNVNQRVEWIQQQVTSNTTDTAAMIFKNITSNATKSLTFLSGDTTWMSDASALVKLFETYPGSSGFKAAATSLNAREALLVHGYLRNLFINYKPS